VADVRHGRHCSACGYPLLPVDISSAQIYCSVKCQLEKDPIDSSPLYVGVRDALLEALNDLDRTSIDEDAREPSS
jgi:hypothetical protein